MSYKRVAASPVVVLDEKFPLEGAQPYAVVGAVLAELLATGTNFRVVEPSGMNSSKWPAAVPVTVSHLAGVGPDRALAS